MLIEILAAATVAAPEMYTADLGTAIFIASLIGGGVSIHQSQEAKKESKKSRKAQERISREQLEAEKKRERQQRKRTSRGTGIKPARSALVVGDPQGVFSGTQSTGRGTLLEN